jgi:hypothetical protein
MNHNTVRQVEEGYDERGRMIDPSNGRPYVLGKPFHGLPTYIYTDTIGYKVRQVLIWVGGPTAAAGVLAFVGRAFNLF